MRANYLHIEKYLWRVILERVPGDLAEFGVWHGTTFMPMAEMARQKDRTIHAVDSFRGMGDPTERDGNEYRRGSHDVGGSRVFRELVKPFGSVVQVHEGFVPEILAEMDKCSFAFVHLDLDQYQPTLDSLLFLWPRMSPGGLIAAHDWYPKRVLAAGAIADWCEKQGVQLLEETEFHHAVIIKP